MRASDESSSESGCRVIDGNTMLPVSAETGYPEVIHGSHGRQGACETGRIPYSRISRIIDVCCMAEMLRNFNITSLRDDEIDRFLELQSFFFELETRCLDEAGFE